MPHCYDPTPEAMITQLLLATCFLMGKTGPGLAMPIDPTRDALEARIVVVECAAEEFGAIGATARAIPRLVQQ